MSIPYTPVGDEAEVFKYYCPLCMLFFKAIMKVSCCGNYICLDCFNDYLHSKGIEEGSTVNTDDMLQNVILEDITCPHCLHYGFQPEYVSHLEIVRDYSRNMPLLHMESVRSNKINAPLPSPLRVGESFEDLKRKMIPFKNHNTLGVVRSDDHSSCTHSISVHNSPENSEVIINENDDINNSNSNNSEIFERNQFYRSRSHSLITSPASAVDESYAIVSSFSPSASGKLQLFLPIALFDHASTNMDNTGENINNNDNKSAVDGNIEISNHNLPPLSLSVNFNSSDSDVLSEASPAGSHDHNVYNCDDHHELSAFSLDLEESLPVLCNNYAHCMMDSIFQSVVMRDT